MNRNRSGPQRDHRKPSQNKNRRGRGRPRRGNKKRGDRRHKGPVVDEGPVDGFFQPEGKDGGFLRLKRRRYLPGDDDVFVPPDLVRKHGLRAGCEVHGTAGRVAGSQRRRLTAVEKINGVEPEKFAEIIPFEEMISIDPLERFDFSASKDISLRVLDILTPLGRGQRALVVAPPRSGKTVLLQKIAKAIRDLDDGTEVLVLLVSERPEEVTEFRRAVGGEVIASSYDDDSRIHAKVADMVLERAKRLAEMGRDVVIVLDSLTRLARAHNVVGGNSGRTMSGGLDAKSLERPKRIFGAARNLEDSGSITIVATTLVDTGSRGDQVIYEEFKGTGNLELVLSRDLANRRIWPAIDIELSGTRKEEKLLDVDDLRRIRALRRVLSRIPGLEAMQMLVEKMERTDSNDAFLGQLDREMRSRAR